MKKILQHDLLPKATEQYFPVVLYIMLYKGILTFESVNKILAKVVTIRKKAIESYFSTVLIIVLYYEVVLYHEVSLRKKS